MLQNGNINDLPVVRGRDILFLYENAERPVSEIRLVHHIALLDRAPMFQKVNDEGTFAFHLVLPPKSRLEYTFGIKYEDGGQEIVTDPRNERKAWCPFGPKSVVWTDRYREPGWSHHRKDIAHGIVEEYRLDSAIFGGSRQGLIYIPPGKVPRGGFPVLIAHDGPDYVNYSGIVDVLDNMIASKEIVPVMAVLTKPEKRNTEYSCTPEHPKFIFEELMPWVRKKYPAAKGRKKTAMMGSSFGAVATAYAAFHYAHEVGLLFLQSGSFRYQDAVRSLPLFEAIDEWDRITLFLEGDFFPKGPAEKMKIFHTCGTFESILQYNQYFSRDIVAAGHTVSYQESNDGHNWISWRNHLGNGFKYLFPGVKMRRTGNPSH